MKSHIVSEACVAEFAWQMAVIMALIAFDTKRKT